MMIEPHTLLMFSAAVTMLLLSPGPTMAFVVAHGASYGLRGGVVAALGIGCADLLLTALTATGVTAIAAAWPPAFDVLRYAGVLYLLYLACQALRSPGSAGAAPATEATLAALFLHAMLNSLLNPKALLFFMVFLPQFADPLRGPVAPQLVLLGCVLAAIGTLFHALLGGASGAVRGLLARHRGAGRLQPYALAAVLLALALRLLLMQRPA